MMPFSTTISFLAQLGRASGLWLASIVQLGLAKHLHGVLGLSECVATAPRAFFRGWKAFFDRGGSCLAWVLPVQPI